MKLNFEYVQFVKVMMTCPMVTHVHSVKFMVTFSMVTFKWRRHPAYQTLLQEFTYSTCPKYKPSPEISNQPNL